MGRQSKREARQQIVKQRKPERHYIIELHFFFK